MRFEAGFDSERGSVVDVRGDMFVRLGIDAGMIDWAEIEVSIVEESGLFISQGFTIY